MRTFALLCLCCLCSPLAAEDWPGFRGPTGQGTSAETGLPLRWGPKENVAWKTPIPGAGWSSPVVRGDRVFVTTATDGNASCRVLCLDRRDGKALWDVEAFRQKLYRIRPKNSYATPTPVTDGERVYAAFNDGGLAALTVDGKPAWVNRDVPFVSVHGLGASPVLYKDLLIMPYDGSSLGEDKAGWMKPWDRALILAVDKATGKERWRAARGPSRLGHVTPIVVNVDGKDQLVSHAGDVAQGFDPETGKRLWSVFGSGEGVVPSPVYADGLIVWASGFGEPALRAVRPGTADREPEVAWQQRRLVSMIPSAVHVRPHLFTVTEKGVAACLEAKTGKVVWEERLGGPHSASPVAADGKIYFLSESGETTVVEAGPAFKVLARNALDEPCQASPAFSRGQIFVRTQRHLFCIGKPSAPGQRPPGGV